jgi:hypothetical protein
VVVLRDQRKDLRVGCYLAWGLFEREGYLGLAVGLTIVKDMQALYWKDLQPPLDRMKSRIACLDWLAENLSTRVARQIPRKEDATALKRVQSVLVDLEEDLRRHFGHRAPAFGHVRRQVAEHLGQLPGPVPLPQRVDDPIPAPSAPAAFDSPAAPPAAAPPLAAAPTVIDLPVITEDAAPAPRPSRAPIPGRILTPVERSRRKARIIASLSVLILVLGLAGGGGAYWFVEIARVDRVAQRLNSGDEGTRVEGLAQLSSLPERQRAALLHDHADAILDHYLALEQTAADRYAFVEADAYLAAARHLYPDSQRVQSAMRDLARARTALPADIRRRLEETKATLLSRIQATLSPADSAEAKRLITGLESRVANGDLRNARLDLDRLSALAPAGDADLAALLPQLTALLALDLAEQRADRQYFTQSLRVIADGLTFLPNNPMLQTAQERYLVGRDEYLLRNTLAAPETLDSLLVREAATHLRSVAPDRWRALAQELMPALEQRLRGAPPPSPERAAALQASARALFSTEDRVN